MSKLKFHAHKKKCHGIFKFLNVQLMTSSLQFLCFQSFLFFIKVQFLIFNIPQIFNTDHLYSLYEHAQYNFGHSNIILLPYSIIQNPTTLYHIVYYIIIVLSLLLTQTTYNIKIKKLKVNKIFNENATA